MTEKMLTTIPERRTTSLATSCVAMEAVNLRSRVDYVVELVEAEHYWPPTANQRKFKICPINRLISFPASQ